MARPVGIAIFAIVAMALVISISNAQSANSTSGNENINLTSITTNLTISGLTIPTAVGTYSPLPVSFNITNSGKYASGNITLSVDIYGLADANRTFNFTGLSPGQSEFVLVYVNNITEVTGKYIAYVNSAYKLNGVEHTSGRGFLPYTVINTQFANPIPGLTVGRIPNMKVTSAPLLFYVPQSVSTLSQIGLLYTGLYPINVNMYVPRSFSSIMSFSTPTLYLTRNQSLSSGILMNPFKQAYENTYIIPINVSATPATPGGGLHMNQSQYMQLSALNMSNSTSRLYEQVEVQNDSTSATGVIQVNSPSKYNIYGSVVQLIIPVGTTPSMSNIDAFGARTQIFEVNGDYIIDWYVGDVQKNQQVYVYYNIMGLSDPGALRSQQLLLYSSSQQTVNGMLKLIKGASTPTFYTNSSQLLQVSILYTGSTTANATLSLSSPIGTTIQNASRTIVVHPNQELLQSFNITTNNYVGTDLLKLGVYVNGVNTTYNMPIVIFHQPTSVLSIAQNFWLTFKYLIFAIFIGVGILIIYLKQRKGNRPQKYSTQRVEQLINLREQLNRRRW